MYTKLRNKIMDKAILDSEIIQDVESAKEIPGFDIDLGCNEENWSLLMVAVDSSREDLVGYLLLDPNINVNYRSKYGNTALHVCDQISILKLLLSLRDLVVNIQNDWERTGLHSICSRGRKACVKEYLLDARVNMFIRDNKGKTARDNALEQGYLGIAKNINNFRHTTLLRIPNNLLLYDIVRMIIDEYA